MSGKSDYDGLKDLFRFMITTDNHLGYKHDDPIRGQDSFESFEESLKLAMKNRVDFILLGGDLFHVSRPNLDSINKCSSLIRKYTFTGDRRPKFARISGEFSHEKFKHGNFEDSGYNISCPIFSIHGNHDEPVGSDPLCVCEALANNASLNYFGCFSRKNQQITIDPLVFEKGNIKIAIYGLGFLPDSWLQKRWEKKHIKFSPPPEKTFTILILHQNTVAHGGISSYISDEMIPKFFDLVIRGHEHDALDPINLGPDRKGQIVYQPGSTVATSLCVGEALPKRIGIVDLVPNDNFFVEDGEKPYKMDIKLLPLKTCRRILIKDLYWSRISQYVDKRIDELHHSSPPNISQYVCDFVSKELDSMLDEYEAEVVSLCLPASEIKKPLVRIRVEFVDASHCFSQIDFKNSYYPERVANTDIVLFKRQKLIKLNDIDPPKVVTFEDSQESVGESDDHNPFDGFNPEPLVIDQMLKNYFNDKPKDERPRGVNFDEFLTDINRDEFLAKYVETYIQGRYNFWKKKFEKLIVDEDWTGANLNDEISIRECIDDMMEKERQKQSDDVKPNINIKQEYSGDEIIID